MTQKVINYVKAGFPGIFIVTSETRRAVQSLLFALKETRSVNYWTYTSGIVDLGEPEESRTAVEGTDDGNISKVYDTFAEMEQKSVLIMQDAHILFNGEKNIELIDRTRKLLAHCKASKKTLIFIGCEFKLVPELDKEWAVVDFDMPTRDEIGFMFDQFPANVKKAAMRNSVIDSSLGMTEPEIENAFSISCVEKKRIDPEVVQREKASMLRKDGLLDLIQVDEDINSIGGLDVLKGYIQRRSKGFGPEAEAAHLPAPRGICVVGIPGTGKTLTAKATANIMKQPLIRLDVGRIFAGIVGSSESNMRAVQKTVDAMSPCILLVDEIEKAFSGTKSSNATDGGTSSRVFGSFIEWMQNRKSKVFIVATANDVTQLPPELLRRFDELFFADLPDEADRADIWKIQLKKHEQKPELFDTAALSQATKFFTGAEIEKLLIEGMYGAFDLGEPLQASHILAAAKTTLPLAMTMQEQIAALQEWGRTRAKSASSKVSPVQIQKKLGVSVSRQERKLELAEEPF